LESISISSIAIAHNSAKPEHTHIKFRKRYNCALTSSAKAAAVLGDAIAEQLKDFRFSALASKFAERGCIAPQAPPPPVAELTRQIRINLIDCYPPKVTHVIL